MFCSFTGACNVNSDSLEFTVCSFAEYCRVLLRLRHVALIISEGLHGASAGSLEVNVSEEFCWDSPLDFSAVRKFFSQVHQEASPRVVPWWSELPRVSARFQKRDPSPRKSLPSSWACLSSWPKRGKGGPRSASPIGSVFRNGRVTAGFP